MKNSVIPVLTFSGLTLAGLLNGSVAIEVVFAWPGIGRLMLEGIKSRDFPVVQATVLAAGFFYNRHRAHRRHHLRLRQPPGSGTIDRHDQPDRYDQPMRLAGAINRYD